MAKRHRVFDVSREDQTDELKLKVYNLVRNFVYKYHTHYYPHFKGEVDDLVGDIYVELLTPKSRVKGQEASLLDKYDPKSMPSSFSSEDAYLANVVKTSVIRKLIDMERSDKQEVPVQNNYDEKTGEATLDYLFQKFSNPDSDEPIEEIEFTPNQILEMRDLYDEMPARSKKAFLEYYEDNKEDLAPNFKRLFEDLVGEDTSKSFKYDKEKSVHTSSKDEVDFAPEVKELDPSLANTHVELHTSRKGDAVRIIFQSKDDMTKASEVKDKLDELMKGKGWTPYTQRSNIWYYLKSE